MPAADTLRVAFDAGALSPEPTGVGRYIVELVAALGRDGEVIPIVIGPDLPVWRELAAGERIVTGRLSGGLSARARRSVFESLQLPDRLRAAAAEVYHAPAFRAPRRVAGLPMVTTVPDLAAFAIPEAQGALRSAWRRAQVRSAIRRARRVIVLSEAIREEMAARFPAARQKIRVIPLGVSRQFFGGAPTESAGPLFVSVATLERRKNLVRLLIAFARVLARYPTAKLRLIGQSENDDLRIRANLAELGIAAAVTLEGHRCDSEVAAAYRSATAVVYPSLYEGFGLPIVEAMAAGAPVVTSDRGAMREVAGGAALLVDPENPSAIADALLQILEDAGVREALRRRGRERAETFTWERCAAAHAQVYREALAD